MRIFRGCLGDLLLFIVHSDSYIQAHHSPAAKAKKSSRCRLQ